MKTYENNTPDKTRGKLYIPLHPVFLSILFFIIISVSFNGCVSDDAFISARGINYGDGISPEVKLSAYKTIQVHVTSGIEGSEKFRCQLEDKIINLLEKRNLFEKVLRGQESQEFQADLQLNAEIMNLKKVRTLERLLVDEFAGKAKVVVVNRLKDVKTGEDLGVFTAGGQSTSGFLAAVSLAGTTKQAVKLAAKQIVKYIKSHM